MLELLGLLSDGYCGFITVGGHTPKGRVLSALTLLAVAGLAVGFLRTGTLAGGLIPAGIAVLFLLPALLCE